LAQRQRLLAGFLFWPLENRIFPVREPVYAPKELAKYEFWFMKSGYPQKNGFFFPARRILCGIA
jgi:hypothetical protein